MSRFEQSAAPLLYRAQPVCEGWAAPRGRRVDLLARSVRTLLLLGACALLSCVQDTSEGQASDPAGRSGAGPRIVSLHDVTSELVVALGGGRHLVGIAQLVDPTPELRAGVLGVPQVESLESIVARRPSLVLGLAVTEKRQPDLVERLRASGVGVHLASPIGLRESAEMIERVGDLLGRGARARELSAAFREQLAQPPPRAERPVRVFVYDCCEPPLSAGGGGLLSELITRAGGRNVFASLRSDWASVSWEAVVARQPELIVIHAYDYRGQKDVASKRRALAQRPGLAAVPTVVMPLGCSLGGLRSLEGLQRLKRAIEALS